MTISCLEIETAVRPDKSECKKKVVTNRLYTKFAL